MTLPFKYADFSNNMGRGLTREEELRIIAAADPQYKNKEVIKMFDKKERTDSPDPGALEQHPMAATREAVTKQLEMLDARLKAIRAERNAVARALRGLAKFY